MNTVVVAGAGTGKTYALVQEYLLSLFGLDGSGKKKHPSQILAVTFTEKAAAEMRARVTSKLLKIARDGIFDTIFIDNATRFDMPLPTSTELHAMSRALLSAPICTFHSFCSQILREYAFASGLDPGFALLVPAEEYDIALDIAESVIVDALSENVAHVGQLVARFQLRRLGESRGIAENLVELYQESCEHGLSAQEIGFPFDDMEGELWCNPIFQKHVDAISACLIAFRCAPRLTDGTRHRLDAVERSLHRLQAAAKSEEVEIALSATYFELREAVSGRFGADELRYTLVDAVVALGSFLCCVITYPDAKCVRLLLHLFAERLGAYKERFAVLGFSDLLRLARDLLRDNLGARQSIKTRFGRILVDEFQDSSPLQEDLVALLCEQRNSQTQIASNQRAMSAFALQSDALFVVGDPKQSIYGFRGADVKLFGRTLQFVTQGSQAFPATGERKSLQLCRRAQGAIVDLVNQVAAATLSQPSEGLSFGAEDHLEALKLPRSSAGAIWQIKIKPEQNKERVVPLAIASEIQKLLDKGAWSPKDITVLVRRIKTALPIVAALQNMGIPARIYGGDGFFSRPEIMDVLAALKLAVDPDDELATLTMLRSPLVAMSDADLVAVLDGMPNWQRGVRFSQIAACIDATLVDDELKYRVAQLSSLLRSIGTRLGEMSVAEAIDILLDEAHYIEALAVENDADERFANLAKLRAMCLHFRADAVARVHKLWDLLDNPPKESLAEPLDVSTNAVQVMTIHQAKGLEFEIVVVADTLSLLNRHTDDIAFDPDIGLAINHKGRPISVCAPQKTDEKKRFPTAIDMVRQKKRQRSEAEMARLLYVALTRAKESIYFVDMAVEGREIIDRGVTLRRLFYQGKERDVDRFDALMPTQVIELGNFCPPPNEKSPSTMSMPRAFREQAPVHRRVFASEIIPLSQDDFPSLPSGKSIDKRPRSSARDLGIVAHQLIARVGSHMSADWSSADIEQMLDASARSIGIFRSQTDAVDLIDACSRTLQGPIANWLRSGYELYFEEPVYEVDARWVLEGYVDLVARGPSQVLIVDFKLSAQAAQKEATWLQLYAYATAIKDPALPIWVSPCVIGDSEPSVRREYNAIAKQRLSEAIIALVPDATFVNP